MLSEEPGFFKGWGVHELKRVQAWGLVGQFADLRGEVAWEKRVSIFSPILEDRVHAMPLQNQLLPNK